MTSEDFGEKCKELCPHCAAGEVARQREDTKEWVHDFSYGVPVSGPFGRRQMGHGICHAHDFRKENKPSE